jgi:hypothetical protein
MRRLVAVWCGYPASSPGGLPACLRRRFASLLMAAGSTLKELTVLMGRANAQTVQRYVNLLPQRDELNPVDRLVAYRRPGRPRWPPTPRVHAGGGTPPTRGL